MTLKQLIHAITISLIKSVFDSVHSVVDSIPILSLTELLKTKALNVFIYFFLENMLEEIPFLKKHTQIKRR